MKDVVGALLSILITISPLFMIRFLPYTNQKSISTTTEKENDYLSSKRNGNRSLENDNQDTNSGSNDNGGSLENSTQSVAPQETYKIAFVKPTFTATAYSSYYTFFSRKKEPEQYLWAKLIDSWSHSSNAVTFVYKMLNNQSDAYNSTVITDVDVHAGKIFHKNAYS